MNEELKRMIRRERYLREIDTAHGLLHYGTETELYKMSPCDIYSIQFEDELQYKELLYEAMHLALSDLKNLNTYWYQLVYSYYLSAPSITLTQLGMMYGVTRQSATKSLKRAMNVLTQLAEEHLENLMNI